MKTIQWKIVCKIFAFYCLASSVHADNNTALYDPSAPADSAFVRVLNLTDSIISFQVDIKKDIQKIPTEQLGGYVFVKPGKRAIELAGVKKTMDLKTRDVKTITFDGKNISVIDDEYFDDRKKALASFYNLLKTPLALKTRDGKLEVIKHIGEQQRASRKLNSLKVVLAAFNKDKKVAEFSEVLFKKGRSYSFIVFEQAGKIKHFSHANTIDPIL